MRKTETLGLPIYDAPESDLFKLQDWNEGNQKIDNKIKEFGSSLDLKVNKSYVFGINTKDDTKGILDVANFAMQGQTNAPIGFVWHHYTDGGVAQIDNVGENNEILVLKNARNITRRPDKANDFVGNGKFLVLKKHDMTLGNQISLFAIDKNCNLNWYEFTPTALLKHTKADDGTSAFDIQCQNKHATMLRFLNGTSVVLEVLNDGTDKTRMHLRSGTSQTGGLQLEARSGDLDLTATNGKIRINGHTRKIVQTAFYGATASERPTSTASIGEMFYDTTLKKPIWFDGTDWRDAMGTTV